jgi:hypothetical protein
MDKRLAPGELKPAKAEQLFCAENKGSYKLFSRGGLDKFSTGGDFTAMWDVFRGRKGREQGTGNREQGRPVKQIPWRE